MVCAWIIVCRGGSIKGEVEGKTSEDEVEVLWVLHIATGEHLPISMLM